MRRYIFKNAKIIVLVLNCRIILRKTYKYQSNNHLVFERVKKDFKSVHINKRPAFTAYSYYFTLSIVIAALITLLTSNRFHASKVIKSSQGITKIKYMALDPS